MSCKQHKAWLGARDKDENMQRATKTEKVFREAYDGLIILVGLPHSFIESPAWRNFCDRFLLYQPHSRRTSVNDIIDRSMELMLEFDVVLCCFFYLFSILTRQSNLFWMLKFETFIWMFKL